MPHSIILECRKIEWSNINSLWSQRSTTRESLTCLDLISTRRHPNEWKLSKHWTMSPTMERQDLLNTPRYDKNRSHLRIFWPEVLQLSMGARKLDTSTTHAARIYIYMMFNSYRYFRPEPAKNDTNQSVEYTLRRQSDPEYDRSLFQTTRYQPFTHACCSPRLGTVADGVTTGGLWSERERQCNTNHLELLQYIIGAVPAAPCVFADGQSDSCVLHQPHGSNQIPCSVA